MENKNPPSQLRQRSHDGFAPLVLIFLSLEAVWLLAIRTTGGSNWHLLTFVSSVALACTILGARRSIRVSGYFDPFHPLVFPLAYIAISFFLPFWVTDVLQRPVGSLARPDAVSNITPYLLVAGVISFAVGAALPFRRRQPGPRLDVNQDAIARNVIAIGRFAALVALLLAVLALARGGVDVRGTGQGQYSLSDSVSAATKIAPLAASVAIVFGHAARTGVATRYQRVISRVDWVILGALVITTALRGTRSSAIAVMLVLIVAHVHKRGAIIKTIMGIGAAATFMVVVLHYRNAARGIGTESTFWEILLGDMAPVGFTTGTVAALVPSRFPFEQGATLVAALYRQLPSPIAVGLFGPPDDTGAQIFRRLIGLDNPNSGVGFSLPADGYLNFGVLGLVGTCFILGMFVAWSYSRFDPRTLTATSALYYIVIGAFPFALRADYLGGVKEVLYPFIFLAVALLVSRTVAPSRGRTVTTTG